MREVGEMGGKGERRDEGESERKKERETLFHQPFGFTDSFYF